MQTLQLPTSTFEEIDTVDLGVGIRMIRISLLSGSRVSKKRGGDD
jgi:hypothetical protein